MQKKSTGVVLKDKKGRLKIPPEGVKIFLKNFENIEHNLEEVMDDEEGVDYSLKLTEKIKVTIESNMPFLNIREWYKHCSGDVFPTRSGVVIFLRDLKKVRSNFLHFLKH